MTAPTPQQSSGGAPGLLASLRNAPVVSVWLALAVVLLPVSLQSPLAPAGLLPSLFVVDLGSLRGLSGQSASTLMSALLATLEGGEFWRLVSPAFLHFGLAHIAFNGVLFLILGIGLEKRVGALALMLCLLLWAAFSNVAQFLVSGSPLFGGLSGVVSAMFGARWLLGYFRPEDPVLFLPKPLVISVLLSLIIFSTGVSALLGVSIANTAHWAGLGIGILTGIILHWSLPRLPTSDERP